MKEPDTTTRLALGRTRWPTLDEFEPLVLVPLGSLEQHGPHLPLATDTMIASAVAQEVARCVDRPGNRVIVAPAIAYGASGEHEDFPGTISIGQDALFGLLVEYARSACRWAGGVVFVSGHGGNASTLVRAVEQLREEGRAVAWTSCAVPGGDAHAGATETSMMRYIAPWSVRVDLAVCGATDPIATLMPLLRTAGVRAVSESGVLGDATRNSAEDGKRDFVMLVRRISGELSAIDVGEGGRLVGELHQSALASQH